MARLSCANPLMPEASLSPDGFIQRICDRDAKRGVTVHDGNTDLDLHDLPVKVSCHEVLSQQFHTVHLRFLPQHPQR